MYSNSNVMYSKVCCVF